MSNLLLLLLLISSFILIDYYSCLINSTAIIHPIELEPNLQHCRILFKPFRNYQQLPEIQQIPYSQINLILHLTGLHRDILVPFRKTPNLFNKPKFQRLDAVDSDWIYIYITVNTTQKYVINGLLFFISDQKKKKNTHWIRVSKIWNQPLMKYT